MTFELLPVLDAMIALYQEPASPARFEHYLRLMLNENRDDIVLPIGGYNPMAKPHVLEQLLKLRTIEVESIMQEVIAAENAECADLLGNEIFFVSLVLADDLMGGWTNRYTTDYSARFETEALLKRQFVTPYCWSSESIDALLIRSRIRAAMIRTAYQLTHSAATTLESHIEQETYIQEALGERGLLAGLSDSARTYYNRYKLSEEHGRIISFLYGDEAAKQLGYEPVGDRFKGILI